MHSSIERLIACTSCVLRFIRNLKAIVRCREFSEDKIGLADDCRCTAEILWIKEAQHDRIKNQWKEQFNLYIDDQGVWRCGGRFGNSELPYHTMHPILLPKGHYYTTLVVRKAHQRVVHSGVKDTLTEICSGIPQGRSFVRHYISQYVVDILRQVISHHLLPLCLSLEFNRVFHFLQLV